MKSPFFQETRPTSRAMAWKLLVTSASSTDGGPYSLTQPWSIASTQQKGASTRWKLGRYGNEFEIAISVHISPHKCGPGARITFMSTYCEIALRWIPPTTFDDLSILVQVMACCRKATIPYLSQCWPRFMSPNGVTRPQWSTTFRLPQNTRHMHFEIHFLVCMLLYLDSNSTKTFPDVQLITDKATNLIQTTYDLVYWRKHASICFHDTTFLFSYIFSCVVFTVGHPFKLIHTFVVFI